MAEPQLGDFRVRAVRADADYSFDEGRVARGEFYYVRDVYRSYVTAIGIRHAWLTYSYHLTEADAVVYHVAQQLET